MVRRPDVGLPELGQLAAQQLQRLHDRTGLRQRRQQLEVERQPLHWIHDGEDSHMRRIHELVLLICNLYFPRFIIIFIMVYFL